MPSEIEIYHPSLLDLLFGGLGVVFILYVLFQDKPEIPESEVGYFAVFVEIDSVFTRQKNIEFTYLDISFNDESITDVVRNNLRDLEEYNSHNYDPFPEGGGFSYLNLKDISQIKEGSKLQVSIIDSSMSGYSPIIDSIDFISFNVKFARKGRQMKTEHYVLFNNQFFINRPENNLILKEYIFQGTNLIPLI